MVIVALASVLIAAAPPGDDPLLDRQYHLRRVRAPQAWEVGKGRGQVIAVIDTGVDADHPDLRGRLVEGVDLVDRRTPPDDENGHGTFVAGVAVAKLDNGRGGSGVAPRARVMPIRVLDKKGRGTSDTVAEGIRWATRRGATVINLSLADVPGQKRPPAALITTDVELAIRQAALSGVVVICAAGNEGERKTPYAQDLPALVVGATDRRDRVWRHSNYDDQTLFAPGVGIISTYVGEPYASADGTSFAAPIVAAGAALLRQQGLDSTATRRRLLRTARPIGKGVGRVDLAAALGVAPRVTSTPSPRPQQTQEPADEPRKPRQPRQPSPIKPLAPIKPLPQAPASEQFQEPTEKPTEVAKADRPKRRKNRPEPQPVPTVTADPGLAADQSPPGDPTPWVPLGIAGGLLFVTVVGLGGYLAARRSGG